MAVLEKIRVKFGILISILIAVALLSFILDPQTLSSASRMLSSDNVVGKMDGKSISYQDFYEEYNNINKIAEILGQSPKTEQEHSQLRDAAWQSMFDQKVFIPKTEASGIAVSEAEMYDLTQGVQISPVLLQQPMFMGQDGVYNRETFASFVQSIENDESGYSSAYYDFLEDNIYRTQLYTKYSSLINGSAVMNSVEKNRLIAENNRTADINYVFVSGGYGLDTTIVVSDAEAKEYYKTHKQLMKQPASRDIEYVMWEVVPSSEDISAGREEFDALYEEFKTTDNLRNFVTLNSDGKYDIYYYKESQLSSIPEFADLIKGVTTGTSDIHIEESSFSAARISDVKMMSDSIKVSYAAFPITEKAKADSLLNVVKKSGKTTDEFQELGWLTQEIALSNGMADFMPLFSLDEKATVIASSQNQANLVFFITEKTKSVKKYQLATIVKNVLPSDNTYRDFQIKATELADAANGKYEQFASYVSANNLPVVPLVGTLEATRQVGTVENARDLIRWVFDKKTKKGDVSDMIVVDNKYYFVAAVTNIHKEGISTFAEVAPTIKNILLSEKAVDAKYNEVIAKIEGAASLEEIAEKFGTTVSNASGIAFGSQAMTIEPTVTGAVAAASDNSIKTVKGQLGIYIFQVVESDEGTFFTENDAQTAASRSAMYQSNMIQSVIADEADIKDNRARFF